MTANPSSDDAPVGAGARRNPLPRPALRFEGDENWVVAARPLPGQGVTDPPEQEGDTHDGERSPGRRKGKGEKGEKASKRDKSGKEHRRRKADKKRAKEATQTSPSTNSGTDGQDDRTVAVTLPPEFRRALERAAGEHGLTAEGLAAFVLVEWLDR